MSDLDKYVTNQQTSYYLSQTNTYVTRYNRAITQLRACRPIPEPQVRELCYKARELLIEEGNVVGVDAPVTVCDTCAVKLGDYCRLTCPPGRYVATFTVNFTI